MGSCWAADLGISLPPQLHSASLSCTTPPLPRYHVTTFPDQPSFFPQTPVVNNHFCPLLSGQEGRGGDPRELTWDQGSPSASPGGPASAGARLTSGNAVSWGGLWGRVQPALGWPSVPSPAAAPADLRVLPTPRCPGAQPWGAGRHRGL